MLHGGTILHGGISLALKQKKESSILIQCPAWPPTSLQSDR